MSSEGQSQHRSLVNASWWGGQGGPGLIVRAPQVSLSLCPARRNWMDAGGSFPVPGGTH